MSARKPIGWRLRRDVMVSRELSKWLEQRDFLNDDSDHGRSLIHVVREIAVTSLRLRIEANRHLSMEFRPDPTSFAARVELPQGGRIVAPPGWRLRSWAMRLVGRRLYNSVFEGQFGEFELEYTEALAVGDFAEAKRIVWRYRVQFAITIVGLVPTSLARLIVTLWKIGS